MFVVALFWALSFWHLEYMGFLISRISIFVIWFAYLKKKKLLYIFFDLFKTRVAFRVVGKKSNTLIFWKILNFKCKYVYIKFYFRKMFT